MKFPGKELSAYHFGYPPVPVGSTAFQSGAGRGQLVASLAQSLSYQLPQKSLKPPQKKKRDRRYPNLILR